LKDGDNVTGIRMKAKIVKNKIAPPFRVAEFDMLTTGGINYELDLLDLAVENKIVKKSGSWFSYGELRLGQGRDKSKVILEENPDICEEIKQKILAAQGVVPTPEEEPEPETEAAEA